MSESVSAATIDFQRNRYPDNEYVALHFGFEGESHAKQRPASGDK